MLVRLFGSNFRSLKGEFELSLVAADLHRDKDRNRGVIAVPIHGMDKPLRLLRVVALYGANASGKSTILTAGRALRWLVTASSERARPGAQLPPYEPFLLEDKSRTGPVTLGCDVICDKKLLRYEVAFKAKAIQTEALTLLDGTSEVKLIDRRATGEVRGELITSSDVNRLYVKEMQPNVAVLSKLAQHGPHQGPDSAVPYYKAIQGATNHVDYSREEETLFSPARERFADDSEYRDWIMRHLIRVADVGICDVHTRRESVEFPDFVREQVAKINGAVKLPDKAVVVSFVHEGSSNRPLEFSEESYGTRKLFHLAEDWWKLAHESVTLLADELSASLHPRLLDRLIRTVNDAPEGVRSQLIFTTHDTGLLEGQDGLPPALRRDQVYFTKKDAQGVTELYSLAEFKDDARPVHNLRKRYLSGLYGALPAVEKLSL